MLRMRRKIQFIFVDTASTTTRLECFSFNFVSFDDHCQGYKTSITLNAFFVHECLKMKARREKLCGMVVFKMYSVM